jgi:peroxin-5
MHDRITDLFLNLARTQHNQDQMDPDLQIALGVLFYTNANYNKAQDCFVAALNIKPKAQVFLPYQQIIRF